MGDDLSILRTLWMIHNFMIDGRPILDDTMNKLSICQNLSLNDDTEPKEKILCRKGQNFKNKKKRKN